MYLPTLVVRWQPYKGNYPVTLQLREDETGQAVGKAIYTEGFEGRLSVRNNQHIRDWIRHWRDSKQKAEGVDAKIYLTLHKDAMGVRFSVLSAREEATVTAALKAWDEGTALLRHLGRAAVFKEFGLFSDALDEYRAARRIVPGSLLIHEAVTELTLKTNP